MFEKAIFIGIFQYPMLPVKSNVLLVLEAKLLSHTNPEFIQLLDNDELTRRLQGKKPFKLM